MGDDLVSRRALRLAALAVLMMAPIAGAAFGSDGAAGDPSLWSRAIAFVMDQQRLLHRQLSGELSALGEHATLATAWALIASSFLYGVFHAAGPGHGKVVLTAYLVSHERRIGRALMLSCAAALCQGLVAIVLVLGLIGLAGFVGRETQEAAVWTERVSFALIAALGAYLVLRSLAPLWRRLHGRETHGHHGHHGHHDHDGCGHSHVVTPDIARRVHDWRTAAAVVVSVGLRPCSGAVMVLAFASILHLTWAGVLAVLAISAGTAITVCILALVAVYASDRAVRLAGMRAGMLALVTRGLALVGGLVILAAGVALLMASFAPAHPLGLGAAY